jgi:hypothetical protein
MTVPDTNDSDIEVEVELNVDGTVPNLAKRPILMNATPAALLPFPRPLVVLTTLKLRLLLRVIGGLSP